MKIIIITGDNKEKVEERIFAFKKVAKKRKWQIENIDLQKEEGLPSRLTSQELFEVDKLFIVRGIEKIKKKESVWLKKNISKYNGNLVLVAKNINKTLEAKLPKIDKKEEYNFPKIIFKFLDSFYPGNSTHALTLLRELEKNESLELVLALLTSHLKNLYFSEIGISQNLPPWREKKLQDQSSEFKKGEIKEIINLLAQADVAAKTSQTSLSSALDLIIATKLE